MLFSYSAVYSSLLHFKTFTHVLFKVLEQLLFSSLCLVLQLNSFSQGLLQERWAQRRWARKEGSEILILSRLRSRSSQRGQPACLGSLSLMLFLGVLHSLVQKLSVFCSLIFPSYCFFRAVGDCVPGRMTRWRTVVASRLLCVRAL